MVENNKPIPLAQMGKWRIVQWDDRRLQLSKQIFNPQTKKTEFRNIPLTPEELLILRELADLAFREWVITFK